MPLPTLAQRIAQLLNPGSWDDLSGLLPSYAVEAQGIRSAHVDSRDGTVVVNLGPTAYCTTQRVVVYRITIEED
jgi:hypothetical protein